MKCTTCRRFVPQGASRCPACGTVFAAPPPAVAPAPVPTNVARERVLAAAVLVNHAHAHPPHGTAIACPAPDKHPQTSPSRRPVASTGVQAIAGAHSASVADPQVLAADATLAGGRYRLGGLLGRGSFGITYRGVDQRLDRAVAIKEFFPEGAYRQRGTVVPPPSLGRAGYEAERAHFVQEARVLAKFQRPGIVRVYEVFEENDTAYMVMEYLEGRTLVEVLRERGGPLPVVEALRYVVAVADALAAVHEQQLLHRDVKPGNIMITPAPKQPDEAVLIDFGAARRYDRYQRTSVMTAIGTPGYAPLEQWGSSGRFGPSSDVYALAATLYHLLTGRMPPSAADRAIDDTLVPPHVLNRSIPEPVSEAVVRGLAVRMEERPQTMAAFAALLRAARNTRPTAPHSTTPITGAPPLKGRGSAPHATGPMAGAPPPNARAAASPQPVRPVAPQAGATAPGPPAPPLARPAPAVASKDGTSTTSSAALPAVTPAAPSAPTPLPTQPRTRRLRVRWPRRRRSLFLWAGASVFAPLMFMSSVLTVTTVLPVLTVLAIACTGELQHAARISLRHAIRFAGFGVAACAVSAASVCVVAGLTVRGIAKTAYAALGPG